MGGKLDWTIGAFYMDHEIENHIRGSIMIYGELQYVCIFQEMITVSHGGPIPGSSLNLISK